MKSKIILIFMIFLMFLVGINGVFAEDMENTGDVSTLAVDYDDEIISAGESSSTANNWADLQAAAINNNVDTIYLNGTNFHPSNQTSFNHDVNIVGLDGSYVGYANWASSSAYNDIPFFVDSNLNVVFENVTFQYMSGNILIKVAGNGNYVFKNCVFSNINATGDHQSVVWLNSGSALIENCTFIECNTSYGAVSNYNEDSVTAVHMTVKDSNFVKNYATVEPGCINNCGQLEVINSTFRDNYAVWWAGAIHTHYEANATIRKSNFINNVAGWNGGALYTYSTLTIIDSDFIGNNCTTNSGGGAIGCLAYWGHTAPTVTITNCNFTDNNNTNDGGLGGAISFNGGTLNVHSTYFRGNDAKTGTAIYAVSLSEGNFVNNTFIENGRRGNNSDGDTLHLTGNYNLDSNTYNNTPMSISVNLDPQFSFTDDVTCVIDVITSYSDVVDNGYYKIYVDGNNTENTTDTSFTVDVSDGNHSVSVVLVSSSIGFTVDSNTVVVPLEAIYLSTTGTSSGDGSYSNPVNSVAAALTLSYNNDIPTIVVDSGTYYLTGSYLTVRGDVHFIGADNVTFDLSGVTSNYAFGITLSTVSSAVFENIDFKNSKKGIIYTTRPLELINCVFEDNKMTGAYGIARSNAIVITNCSFKNNSMSSTSSSASLIKSTAVTITNSVFENNNVKKSLVYLTSGNIVNSEFVNNGVTMGVLYLYGSSNTFKITNSSFIDNICSSIGGAINANQFTNVYVDGCLFGDNDATNGGAIYVGSRTSTSFVDVKNSILVGNGGTYAIARANSNSALTVTANDNWWGNTANNMASSPNVPVGVSVDNWLFLSGSSVTYAEDCEFVSLKLYNYYNASGIVSNFDASNLLAFNLSISVDDGIISDSIVTLDEGFASFYVYNVTGNTFMVNASYYDDTYSFVCNVDGLKSDSYAIVRIKDISENASVVVNIPVTATGDVILTINGIDTILNCVNGVGNYIISNLESNIKYYIDVTYSGDSVYYGASNSTFFMLYDDSQYNMVGYDAYNTGKSDYAGLTSLNENWHINVGENITNAVVDGDGNVYVANGTVIYAFNNNGVLLWRYEAPGYSTFSGLAISRDVIIAPREGYKLYLVNRFTGKDYSTANLFKASSKFAPVVDENANIYISGEYQVDYGYYNLVIVPYSTWMFGDEIITINIGNNSPTSSPVIINDELVCVNTDNGLLIVNLTSKNVQHIINDTSNARPVVSSNGIIYYLTNAGYIRGITSEGIEYHSYYNFKGNFIALDENNNRVYLIGKTNGTIIYNMSLTKIANNSALDFNRITIDVNGNAYGINSSKGVFVLTISGNDIVVDLIDTSNVTVNYMILVDGIIYVIDNDNSLHSFSNNISLLSSVNSILGMENSLISFSNAFTSVSNVFMLSNNKNEEILGVSYDDVLSDDSDSYWAREEDGYSSLQELSDTINALSGFDGEPETCIHEEDNGIITIPKSYYKDESGGEKVILYPAAYFSTYDEDSGEWEINEEENLCLYPCYDGNGSVIDIDGDFSYFFFYAQSNCEIYKFNATLKNFKFVNFKYQTQAYRSYSEFIVLTEDSEMLWLGITLINCTFENCAGNIFRYPNVNLINCTFINCRNGYSDYGDVPVALIDSRTGSRIINCTFIDSAKVFEFKDTYDNIYIVNNTFYNNDYVFSSTVPNTNNFVFEDNYIVINKNSQRLYGDDGAYVTTPQANCPYPYFNHHIICGNYPLKTNIIVSVDGSNLVFTLDTSDNGNLTLDDGTIIPITGGIGSKLIDKSPGETVEGTISGYLGEKYYALSSDYSLTVPKTNPDFTIEADSIIYSQSIPSVTINSENDPDFNITVWDVTNALVYNTTSKKGTINLKELAAGNYIINVTSIEDDTYNSVSKTTTLTISQAGTEITSTEVNDNNLLITLNNTLVNGVASVNINDIPYYADVENGAITLDVSKLEPKDYTAYVSYLGNTNFTEFTNKEITFTINDERTTPTIEAEDFTINEGDKALINVTIAGATGDVVVIIDETKYLSTLDGEGKATITVPGLSKGEVKANINYTGDNNYLPVNKTITITVNEVAPPELIDPKLSLSVDGTVITVSINDTATGLVIIGVGDIAFVSDAGELAPIDVSDYLVGGIYDVEVTYVGDDVFANATDSGSVTVPDEPVIEPKDPNLKLNINDTVITVSINATATGDIIVAVGDIAFVQDASELAPIDVSDYLVAGTYPVTVKYVGDDVFANATQSGSVTVPEEPVIEPKDPNLKATSANTTITATLNKDATGNVLVDVGGNGYYAPIENGKAVIEVTGLEAGKTYDALVSYAGDDNFKASNVTVKVTVPKDEPAEPKDPYLKLNIKDTVITVSINDAATGTVIIGVGDIAFVQDASELEPVDVSNYLVAGTYPVTVKYVGDDVFKAANATGSVTVPDEPVVEPKDPELKAFAEDSDVIITLNKDATGMVLVDVEGTVLFFPALGEPIVVDLFFLNPGNYTIGVEYLGDEVFAPANATVTLSIPEDERKDAGLKASVSGTELTVSLDDNATGYVLAGVEGGLLFYEYEGKDIVVDLSYLEAGNYSIIVIYSGDEVFYPAETSANITIPEEPVVEPKDPNLKATAANTTINVSVDKDATGNVLVDVDGTGYYAPIKNGQATIDVIGLDEGKYQATVTYAGDDVFKAANTTVSITVPKKEDPVPEPVDPKADISISEDGVDITLPKDATGYMLVDVDGEGYYAPVKDGKASLDLPELAAGNHSVTVTYTGDKKYAQANATKTISVENPVETIISDNLTKVEKSPDRFEATFTDAQGNALANTDVKFVISGNTYTRTTDASGKAGMNINLPAGNYSITVINPVTNETKVNTITVLPRIESGDLVKYFKNASQFYVKVLGDDGNPVKAGEVVTFNINGVFYNRTTDSNGMAKLSINLIDGDYVITTEYKGCKAANNIKVLPILTAKDLTKQYGKAGVFEATLVDGQGKAYANQQVEFNINGVFYKRTTDANGVAKLNINLQAGKYIVTSSYGGFSIANTVTVTA